MPLRIITSLLLLSFIACTAPEQEHSKLNVIFDTDANNELDDQHALAYLLSNGDVFDLKGVTVNATKSGGNIDEQYKEAERILKLYNLKGKVPLLKGANASLPEIDSLPQDGHEAVDFMIDKANEGPLTIIAVGKLTTVAQAVKKDSSFASKVKLVWLGSNYPEPGEYNQDNDTTALNYLLNSSIPFEIVTVRYGKPSGTAAVLAYQSEINSKMPGLGPKADQSITGRHGGTFNTFGDYSVNLFEHIHYDGTPKARSLFDMVAVAILKNKAWGEQKQIPAPILMDNQWQERPENNRKITIWENFKRDEIMADFFDSIENYELVSTQQMEPNH
ncbi:nucleoside hydrolase [Jiulongibacter sediminis]|jgi:inosine-uridine nucleoside N-ribohydrolase|uniref:nucleoside hydrolase n=1 Tax=Jiulongibacter sediminis TaxID=1605367 RepID=UPI0026F20C8E|nr:nucleoside hydrolase [Jiulongibacter sediminis]